MLTEQEVIEIANNHIKMFEGEVGELVAPKEAMIKKNYGIYFRYVLKIYYEMRDERYNTLLGNAPFLVKNNDGKIIEFGTLGNLDYYIKEYEAGRYS